MMMVIWPLQVAQGGLAWSPSRAPGLAGGGLQVVGMYVLSIAYVCSRVVSSHQHSLILLPLQTG